jgi:hypothetical protein
MNKTQIIKELTDLFVLVEPLKIRNTELENSSLSSLLSERAEKIFNYFGLTYSLKVGKVLDEFVWQDELTPESLEKFMSTLTDIAGECLSEPVNDNLSNDLAQEKQVKPIVPHEVFEYVQKNLLLPLDETEFSQIEIGIRILWNYSLAESIGDWDFKRSVDQYLTSIESPMDRGKMVKIVDLVLEYLEEIGQWK